jgi:hypothetical protein
MASKTLRRQRQRLRRTEKKPLSGGKKYDDVPLFLNNIHDIFSIFFW